MVQVVFGNGAIAFGSWGPWPESLPALGAAAALAGEVVRLSRQDLNRALLRRFSALLRVDEARRLTGAAWLLTAALVRFLVFDREMAAAWLFLAGLVRRRRWSGVRSRGCGAGASRRRGGPVPGQCSGIGVWRPGLWPRAWPGCCFCRGMIICGRRWPPAWCCSRFGGFEEVWKGLWGIPREAGGLLEDLSS